jgi:hypothetical protein
MNAKRTLVKAVFWILIGSFLMPDRTLAKTLSHRLDPCYRRSTERALAKAWVLIGPLLRPEPQARPFMDEVLTESLLRHEY